MAASTRKAKRGTPRRSDPHVKHYDTIADAERLINADENYKYVFVPTDDPNVMGDYTAQGYEEVPYTANGVRPGAVRVNPSMYSQTIVRRGCVLMQIERTLVERRETLNMAEFNAMYAQIHKSRTGLSESADELRMKGSRTGEPMLSVRNETSSLRRSGVVRSAPNNEG
jgi:hypothetical protein